MDNPRIDIGGSGNANANALDGAVRRATRFPQVVNEPDDSLDDGFLSLIRQGGTLALVINLACIGICDRGTQIGPTEVDANIVIHRRYPPLDTRTGLKVITSGDSTTDPFCPSLRTHQELVEPIHPVWPR